MHRPQWTVSMRSAIAALVIALTGLLAANPAAALEGRPTVIDAGTIEIAGTTVRLFGLDAPAADATCPRVDGTRWDCGRQAVFGLAALLERHWVTCVPQGRDARGLVTAVCRMGGAQGIDVGQRLVADGWARPDPSQSDAYVADEQAARAAGLGLWAR